VKGKYMQIVRKITIKSLGLQPSKTEPKQLMRIVGVITDLDGGESTYGSYVKLLGTFQAEDLETGLVYRSGAAILPPLANDLVVGLYQSLEPGAVLEIAFDIGTVPADTPTGYQYTVTPLIQEEDGDRLAELVNRAKLSLPA
jgi:hypothetical protein